jgi:hypothetical protein
MTTPVLKGETEQTRAHFAFNGTIAVPMYSLMFQDADDVKPAASMTDQGSEALNQAMFARLFAGIALESALVTDTDAVSRFPVSPRQVARVDCTSATFEVGDLVAAVESAGGVALENVKVVKTLNPFLSIGHVVEREASASTSVTVEFRATVSKGNSAVDNARGPLNVGPALAATLTGTKVLSVNEPRLQVLDPGGSARQVDLPAEAVSGGDSWIIKNSADAAEVITIKNDGGDTLATPTQSEAAICVCDGVDWHCFVMSSGV